MTPIAADILRALETDKPVALFLKLAPTAPHAQALPELVQQLIDGVEKVTGLPAQHLFRTTDEVLHVCAMPLFLRELLSRPAISQAALIPDHGSAYIAPRNVTPVG
jgi:hypothetical protein